jgi:hypothetical protein
MHCRARRAGSTAGEASGKQQDDGQRFKKKLMKPTTTKSRNEASAPANVQPSSVQNESPFGEVIYSYTRKQAIADGVQVEVSQTARRKGSGLSMGCFWLYKMVKK